jgi:hypothetical protein
MAALTYLERAHTRETQRVAPFTGEGAYHGSTKPRAQASGAPPSAPRHEPQVVEEMRATTLDGLAPDDPIPEFDARFANRCELVEQLEVPSQAALAAERTTFCWCPLADALALAGPLTHAVLAAMQRHLVGHKRFVYIDSKLQYFERGDVPVDSQHWHVDGSISVRGPRVEARGHGVMHDMLARHRAPAIGPTYLSYQSSTHCATRFVSEPITLRMPALIPDFDGLDRAVRTLDPACLAQPAAAIVRFDGLSLHRACAADDAGWRLWIRLVETDREVVLDRDIIACYGTVFRP